MEWSHRTRNEEGEVRMKSRRRVNSYFAFLQSASLACFDNAPSDCVDIVGRMGGAALNLWPGHMYWQDWTNGEIAICRGREVSAIV